MTRLWVLVWLSGCTFSLPRSPDVLVVVLDGVRADRLATFGAPRATSNQLDAIASAGVAFHDATASGAWSWPGHASLFTGEPPWVHGAHWASPADASSEEPGTVTVTAMRSEIPTLAERFEGAGYRTVALTSNAMLKPDHGLTRGFATVESYGSDDRVVAAAESQLGEPDPRPVFMVVTLSAAQGPLQLTPLAPWANKHRRMLHRKHAPDWVKRHRVDSIPPALDLVTRTAPSSRTGEESFARGTLNLSEFDLEFVRDLYDGELLQLDRSLGELVGAWNRSERGSGIIAVTSSSGTMLGEEGLLGDGVRFTAVSNRVPLVIAAPGRLDAGVDVYTPVQMRELHPTLLDLSGVESSASGSLVSVLSGEARTAPIQSAVWPNPTFVRNVGQRFSEGQRLHREGSVAVLLDGTDRAKRVDLTQQTGAVDVDPSASSDPVIQRARSAFGNDGPSTVVTVPDHDVSLRQAMVLVD